MQVVVLGAGLAGLAAAFELTRLGHRVTVLEKERYVGGMASSWQVGPYWLDHGPHRFHSRDPELIRHLYEVLDQEVVIRQRRSRIFLRGKFFDYPLRTSNVLRGLPPWLLARSVLDYLWTRVRELVRPTPDTNFETWVVKRFGRTLYDLFFGTYTSKAWGMPCSEISADWAAQRISQANLWDTIKKTLVPPREGQVRSLVSEFWYPARGGIGSIGRGYADKIRAAGGEVLTGTPVERIDVEDGRARRVHAVVDGRARVFECDEVVNTIPLPRLLQSLHGPHGPLIGNPERAAIAALKYIGIVFVYLEVQRPSLMPDHWVYLPSKDLTIHRIAEFKNFSDTTAPGASTVVCCEITCRPGDERWNLTLEQAGAIAEGDLVRAGLLEAGDSRPLELARLPYAYPVYDLTYRANAELLRQAVRRVENLATTGRQGLYRYNNMDHSIAMGRKIARSLARRARGPTATEEAGVVAAEAEYFG